MIRNYFKTAWRNLLKSRGFSLINISGLALGLACFILIAIYILDELSFDRYHEKADRIYRPSSHIIFAGNELNTAVTSDMMGETLKKDYPEVEEFTRIYQSSGARMVKKNNRWIHEGRVAFVDSTFFKVFTFQALAGGLSTALTRPGKVVLSETAARKYFNTTDVVGKSIEILDNNNRVYEVTAVIKDMPRTSHFRYDFLFPMKNINYNWGEYLSHNFHTYLLLEEGADYKALEEKFEQYIENHILPQAREAVGINSMEEFRKSGNQLEYSLMPLTDIYLHSDLAIELGQNGSIRYVYIFGMVALFILLIACINFMNLSTARSAGRAREVGIRKVMGTDKASLIGQFLTESTLLAIISTAIALVIVYFTLPLFNELSAKAFTWSDLLQPKIVASLLILPLAVGLLAGYYPALYLSAFRPVEVLKGYAGGRSARSRLRSGLVVFQFATSAFLIIGTIVVYQQLSYMRGKKIGYKKENVLIIDDYYSLHGNTAAFKTEALKISGVTSATISGYLPVSYSSRNNQLYSREATTTADNSLSMQSWPVDPDYIPTLGIEMTEGRNFMTGNLADSAAVILNEAAVAHLGYDNPIGQKLYRENDGTIAYEIIGVVKDFNYESLRQQVYPLGLFLGNNTQTASFKINTSDAAALVSKMEALWGRMAPGWPFKYRFMDEAFDDMYRTEQRVGRVALSFSVIAILIACLGLLGLAGYMTEQRTKEVGIRKVMGASVGSLVRILSGDFLKLVLIGYAISAPLAWWVMNSWLQDFAYRIHIGWWVFALAAVLALFIAVVTVGFQTVKAALANPVKSLRTE